jgi:hypothetical protein
MLRPDVWHRPSQFQPEDNGLLSGNLCVSSSPSRQVACQGNGSGEEIHGVQVRPVLRSTTVSAAALGNDGGHAQSPIVSCA